MGEISLPHFHDSLALFVGDLRAWVFSSQSKSARYFGLSHTTISRYESGQLLPPPEYVISLAQLCGKRFAEVGADFDDYAETLLREVNRVLQWCYPDYALLQNWQELLEHSKNFDSNAVGVVENQCMYWGDAPDVSLFFGREADQAQLKRWITVDHCRLIAVLGLGGAGKTWLVTTVAKQVAGHFDALIWLSLRNMPPLEDTLHLCFQLLAEQNIAGEGLLSQMSLFLAALRQRRCLVILDNLEAIMDRGERSGHYLPGYEGYGELFRCIGESEHLSCLIFTSREKTAEFDFLSEPNGRIRVLHLRAITTAEGKGLLQHYQLKGSEQDWQALVTRYSGNPLALKLVADTIHEIFNQEIDAWLKTGRLTPPGVSDILEQQFERATPLEMEVLYKLAVERKPLSFDELYQNMLQPRTHDVLSKALLTLRRRSLIEKKDYSFTLQNVVMEYATEHFVRRVSDEMITEKISVFHRVALLKADVDDFVRESQMRLVLKPIVERLSDQLGPEEMRAKLFHLLATLKSQVPHQPGYAGGNLLNLMLYVGVDIRGADFSELSIWRAYLRDAILQETNFRGVDFSHSVFANLLEGVNAIVLSPDNQYLAIATDRRVQIWQMAHFELQAVLNAHEDLVWAVSFAPDGKSLFTGSADHTVRAWDFLENRVIAILPHTAWVWAVAVSPNGALVASAGEGCSIYLWDAHTGELLNELIGHHGPIRALAFHPDGYTLASGGQDQAICIWDVRNGHLLAALADPGCEVFSVTFDPPGEYLLSGGSDRAVKIWCWKSGKLSAKLQGHAQAVTSVVTNLQGDRVASASYDGTIRLWDWHTCRELNVLRGHAQAVKAVVFDPAGDVLISGGYDQTVRFWQTETGLLKHTLKGYSFQVKSIAFSPDSSRLATCSTDYATRVWHLQSGQLLHTLRGHARWVAAVAFSPDGNLLASGSYDRTIRLWQAQTGHLMRVLQAQNWISALAFSPDGALLAAAGVAAEIYLWQVSTGRLLATLEGHRGGVCCLAFHPGQTLLASSGEDHAIRLWDLKSKQWAATLLGHQSPPSWLAFAQNGEKIVSVDRSERVCCWNIHTRSLETSWFGPAGASFATFSPDGGRLAWGSETGQVRVFDPCAGKVERSFALCDETISTLSFNPQGDLLASGCLNGLIQVWDVKSGSNMQTLQVNRPYEKMDITAATGISESQKEMLKALGAIASAAQLTHSRV